MKRRRIKTRRQNSYQTLGKRFSSFLQRLTKLVVRSRLRIPRRSRLSRSGFVLPTVTMVLLVVILLTTTMALRSFDRTRIASNMRASQAAVNAATPAIARARVKVEELLKDPTLPQGDLSSSALYKVIKHNPRYTFGDETRLRLSFDINNNNAIEANDTDLKNNETLTTAWRFAVDTDNNGRFDSYTLYGIYFRSPSRTATGEARGNINRPRNPLEARLPPMTDRATDSRCADLLNASNSPLGDSGWYSSGGELKKSFFVYTATVPITNNTGLSNQFETFPGNSSFSALEYQQDQSRIPLSNYAVWFDNDLELAPSSDFRLNGRVHTNGNLLVGGHDNAVVRFYQVSSENSCFYQAENAKISVGGNVANGNVTDTFDRNPVEVDLFDDNPEYDRDRIGSTNKSTESVGGFEVAYDDRAYNQRIALMKQAALKECREGFRYCSTINPPQINTVLAIAQYPVEVKQRFRDRLQQNRSLNAYNVLSEELELYLKQRTRRVPYAEISQIENDILGSYDEENVFAGLRIIEPPIEWREPTETNTNLQLRTRQLEATWPEEQQQDGKETYLGDRILVGNNLPAYWKDGNSYVTASKERQLIAGINWTQPDDKPRYRSTQVQPLQSGMTDRDNFWEEKAAENPASLSNSGGLRIITGAGIYQHKGNPASLIQGLQTDSFLPTPPSKLDSGKDIPDPPEYLQLAGERLDKYTLVWSDTMPMTGGIEQGQPDIRPPDLRMRATAVYHYKDTSYTDTSYINRTPTACISSYYDPTNSLTARNPVGLPDVSGELTARALPAQPDGGVGRSNNGVVYPSPYTSNNGRFQAIATYLTELKAQAKLMFPSGRLVNEPLQNALRKLNTNGGLTDPGKPLSLSENSAIDTAICALEILDGALDLVRTNPIIPHGAIREASFLDGREVKALNREPNSTENYDLDLELRQPLEIRVTEINLDIEETEGITRKRFGTGTDEEYLLPNNGIIYASRDDALQDDSNAFSDESNEGTSISTIQGDRPNESKLLSPTDFKLDSTRRPNGIRLINGGILSRTEENTYRAEEKGLILVSNLPIYIKGNFNLHQTPTDTKLEEFSETLDLSNWSNFYTRAANNLNPNFACRRGQPGCLNGEGDTWRPATIIADAVTLLSDSFRDGFRSEGDYDLNNNAVISTIEDQESATQKRKNIGFWDNSFVTSAAWWDTNSNGSSFPNQKTDDSYVGSYLTNGVTPVQRRTLFPEYVMEICRKIPVENCGAGDWVVGYDNDGNGRLDDSEIRTQASNVVSTDRSKLEVKRLGAGTTAQPALQPEDRRYPRRVAFLPNSGSGGAGGGASGAGTPGGGGAGTGSTPSGAGTPGDGGAGTGTPRGNLQGNLNINFFISQNNTQPESDAGGDSGGTPGSNNNGAGGSGAGSSSGSVSNPPIPLGIDNQGQVQRYPYSNERQAQQLPRQVANALWFKTTSNTADPTQGESYSPNQPLFIKELANGKPLLVPVLQIHSPDGSPSDGLNRGNPIDYAPNWLQTAEEDTTFNATFVAGNSPSRLEEGSAGLTNFVRFLENWQDRTVNISGSFIQPWRSVYATAPFATILSETATASANASDNLSLFDTAINTYGTNNGTPAGTVPYYGEPIRHWSFDVALLSHSFDLFAQSFTAPSANSPNEFFREVGKDDPWVQTLLCAATASDRIGRATATYNQFAVTDKSLRPATCKNDVPLYQESSIEQFSN